MTGPQNIHAQNTTTTTIMTPNKPLSDVTHKISSVITKNVLPSDVLLTNSVYHMVFMAITPKRDVTKNDLVSNYRNPETMATWCDSLSHSHKGSLHRVIM
jgi:hypothetical protein